MANCVSDSLGIIHIITAKINEYKCCFTLCRRRIEYSTSNNFSVTGRSPDSCEICQDMYNKFYNINNQLNMSPRTAKGNLVNKLFMSLNQAAFVNKFQFKLFNRDYNPTINKYKKLAR